jgi:hypothetical protein
VFVCVEYLFELAYCAFLCLDAVLEAREVLLVALPVGAQFVQRCLVAGFECAQAALEVGVGGAVLVECLGEVGDGLLVGFQLRQGFFEAGLQICEQTSSAGAWARSLLPPRRLRFWIAAAAFPAGHARLGRCYSASSVCATSASFALAALTSSCWWASFFSS